MGCRLCGYKVVKGKRRRLFCTDPRAKDNRHKFFRVGRDLDFSMKVFLPEAEAVALRTILNRDSAFLRDHGIMDYSLLVGLRFQNVGLQNLTHGVYMRLFAHPDTVCSCSIAWLHPWF